MKAICTKCGSDMRKVKNYASFVYGETYLCDKCGGMEIHY